MHRSFSASLVLASTALVVFACGGSTTSGGGTGTSVEASSCNDYYNAFTAANACNSIATPSSEVERLRSRFTSLCEAELSLPGSTITPAYFEACAKAVSADPCGSSFPECVPPPGTGAPGAPCVDDSQCAEECRLTSSAPTDGGPQSALCGTCTGAIAVGQPCNAETPCVAGAGCGADPTNPVCTTITQGGVGASCTDGTVQCGPGLFCGPSGTCVAPGGVGASCYLENECTGTLVCANDVCAVGAAAGAACTSDTACARGLACDTATSTCTAITWAAAGQPCGPTANCLVGQCNYGSTPTVTGSCPTVLDEGQPCPTTAAETCDTYLQCVNGVCGLPTANVCN